MSSLVIVGTGHAGYTLAREWRRLDASTPLTLITQDDGASYYKPDLSKAFAAGKDATTVVKATAPELARELNAELRTQTVVTRIDPASHQVFAGNEPIAYGKLVIAVGAEPLRLPIMGDAALAMPVNNRGDYARFRAKLTPGCRVLIIGAGLIGCEFANDLSVAGYQVSVVDLANRPLARFLPQPCGQALQEALEAIGVTWRLGVSVSALRTHAPGTPTVATLSDGSTLETDVVLSAVGLRPNVTLAKGAGIECGVGITVNAYLRTSAPDVYALGDCAEIAGRSLPFILPIANGVRALAPTLAGTPTQAKFPAMPTPVKTPACPVVICPPASAKGEWTIAGTAPDLEAIFIDETGVPAGFALLGKATARRGALAASLPALT